MFIEAIENRQGWKVCCPEEIAYRSGFHRCRQLEKLAQPLLKTEYGAYLMACCTSAVMEFEPTRLPEVVLIKPRVFGDARGFFFETWQEAKIRGAPASAPTSCRTITAIRLGIRCAACIFRFKQPQGKLVRVTRGEVFDVAVDMRRSSPRFGQWVGVVLSDTNHHMLWVPPGFAHGYLALSEEIDFVYKCTDYYAPAARARGPMG
jgi:dTDP-4-dehydrorhamnose 3,5-epimerase